jgi:DNA-binding transcriptional regulator YhcF (GntR family)
MPLQGNIRDFSTTQLLNLINLARKTGTLTIFDGVKTGEKDAMGNEKLAPGAERARVAFNTGKLIYASLDSQDSNLVSVLNRAGKLTDDQARIIRERAKNTTDKALALLLINANYVSQNDIVTSIKQHTLDVVYNLLTWNDGPFRFDDGKMPGNDRIMVPIELENVIIEGSRRIREAEKLVEHLPNLDYALDFPPNPKEKYKGIHLSVEEWRVVSFVNPKNTIRQIAKANNMSDIEIRRIVYGLEQAGLVVMIKPAGMEAAPTTARKRPPKAVAPQVQKNVVNKLIDKIKSI